MKIGLMVAMQKEMNLFADIAKNLATETIGTQQFSCGQIKTHEITATVSGIGKVNAALSAAFLINHFKVDMILNIGVSGGLDSTLNIGDFVLGEDIVYHDVWSGEGYPYGQVQDMPLYYHSASDLAAKCPPYRRGLLCCGDKFITSADELNAIKAAFPKALAVDMESAAIAQTCHIQQIPFLCVRQISDTPGVEHHAEQYDYFWHHAPQNSIIEFKNILERL
jgi:adenosylhomocysteine nucleosidase